LLVQKGGKQSKIVDWRRNAIRRVRLKGDATLKQFTLHHYREAQIRNEADGRNLVRFDPSDISKRSSYLLFPVREPDGRFAPFGGQTDLGLRAIIPIPFESH
jgi:hypothetical protein